MTCPYENCKYHPETKTDPQFKHIRTLKGKNIDIRGYECPKCKRSFTTETKSVPEPFYQREKDGYFRIPQA